MSESNRVLVVDDEPNIVDVISMALRFQSFTVESAGTGTDALADVASFRPDLIVLDVMLPDMEGFDVARRLEDEAARMGVHVEDLLTLARLDVVREPRTPPAAAPPSRSGPGPLTYTPV